MKRYFQSDNTSPAAPEMLAALAASNDGYAAAYGDDQWSQQLDATFGRFFGKAVRVYPVATGTAANAIALAAMTPPYGAVFCHREAHIVRDECGAPEFMSGGARLVLVDGQLGKLTPSALATALDDNPRSVHSPQAACVSISQATECGTTYSPTEIAAVSAIARQRGLALHMDGARFANSLCFLDCHPGDITWRAGVDVLSFGATKNGALGAEAVVFFDPARVADFELRRKRSGHLVSKTRYLSAQLLAYLQDDLWHRHAEHANRLAAQLAGSAGDVLLYPVQANEVFVQLDSARLARLREMGFQFYDWGAVDSGAARFVVSWNQSAEDVASLCAALTDL
jgi:threonine aldolase